MENKYYKNCVSCGELIDIDDIHCTQCQDNVKKAVDEGIYFEPQYIGGIDD